MADLLTHDTKIPSDKDIVQFAKDHRISLTAGDYQLTLSGTVEVETADGSKSLTLHDKNQDFSVAAERFQMPPNQVRAVFPPAAGKGDYWNTLPHIILKRSTLPWERSAIMGAPPDSPTWLALLVFHDDDPPPQVRSVKVIDLEFYPKDADITPDNLQGCKPPVRGVEMQVKICREESDKQDQLVNMIEVHRKVLPSKDELTPLSHVRRRLAFLSEWGSLDEAIATLGDIHSFDETEVEPAALPTDVTEAHKFKDHASGESYEILKHHSGDLPYKVYHVVHEAATIIANRLPKPRARNVVHLVSVEERYAESSEVFEAKTRDHFLADTSVQLVSLYQWSFYCEEEMYTFQGLLKGLNSGGGAGVPGTLRLPPASEPAESFLKSGFVPLRHRLRDGSTAVSWYHGPLVPSANGLGREELAPVESEDLFNIRHADQLLIYDATNGLLDVSYAAAWELGRALTLRNTKIAQELYNWKRKHAQNIQATRHLADYGYHLGSTQSLNQSYPDGTAIWDWLDQLSLLQHVPFQYLVPDEALLPLESLRLIEVDDRWIQCLTDGAFSIGRVLTQDTQSDKNLKDNYRPAGSNGVISGFLLHSKLVSGYPDIQIAAYAQTNPPPPEKPPEDQNIDGLLTIIRKEKLGSDVLLVLFSGAIALIDFYLPPETLHFGFSKNNVAGDPASGYPDQLEVNPRNPNTGEEEEVAPIPINLKTWGGMTGMRVVNIDELHADLQTGGYLPGDIGPTHSGTIALQLLASNDLIRFNII